MQNRQNREPAEPNPMMIFAILSGLFVLLVMVVFIAVIYMGAISLNKPSVSNGPYNLADRPVPEVADAGKLLPKQLGGFQRGPLTGSLDDYKATYKSGDYQIDISGTQAVSVVSAQAYVNRALQAETGAAIAQRQMSGDPSYYITTGSGAVHFVWSHYRWFFNVKANSQAALDEFMKVFKY